MVVTRKEEALGRRHHDSGRGVREVLRGSPEHTRRPHAVVLQLPSVLHHQCQLPETQVQLRGPVLGVRRRPDHRGSGRRSVHQPAAGQQRQAAAAAAAARLGGGGRDGRWGSAATDGTAAAAAWTPAAQLTAGPVAQPPARI